MILAIRTDRDDAQLALLEKNKLVQEINWVAGRQLAETLLGKIEDLLKQAGCEWPDLTGIVVFRGPGSFTGLRIGIATANAIAYSLNISIAGAGGEDWVTNGVELLNKTKTGKYVIPKYGRPPRITKPKTSAKGQTL